MHLLAVDFTLFSAKMYLGLYYTLTLDGLVSVAPSLLKMCWLPGLTIQTKVPSPNPAYSALDHVAGHLISSVA